MIIGKLKDLNLYKGLSKNIDKAIDYAISTDLLSLAAGKYEIDGKNIYVNRQSYIGKPLADCAAENHKDYLDLQIVLKGTEGFGYADISNNTLNLIEPYNKEKDVTKYTCIDETIYTMTMGSFAILFPEDIHRPQIKINDSTVEKAVIKIKI
ncbi:MAG: YhcH/YjgK/YiaL family protein [Fusobacteriaceae bacterium]|jgi:YhcH/YjgK/YiaL family protein|nr:YhcH/YjgK/YiaL family protein [Fusobacteriaceae bacterium]